MHPAGAVAEFVARVRKESPETAILIDEAYHDYVTDPAYATALPLALEHPNVFIARTLSKAYGMAGMRVGYAVGQPRTIEAFNRWAITFNQNSLAVAAAVASLDDPAHIEAERARNAEARAFTTRFFTDLGYKVMDSQTNFVFAEIGRSAREFKEACAKRGIMVGREFPPLEKTHARVSIGTIDEMQRAGVVIAEVLGPSGPMRAGSPSSSRRPGERELPRKEAAMALTRRAFVEAAGHRRRRPAGRPRGTPGPALFQAPGPAAARGRSCSTTTRTRSGPARPSSTPCATHSGTGGPAGRYAFRRRRRPPRRPSPRSSASSPRTS